MPNTLVLFEDTHWRFAQPVIQARGQTLNFSGTRLSAVFRESAGGPVIAEVSSDDGSLVFVPGIEPYFLFDIPKSKRAWTTRRAVAVYADISRAPDPSKPADIFPLGRTNVVVHPGTGSASIATQATSPVLVAAQPYGGLTVAAPIQIGPQGPRGPMGDLTAEALAAQAAAEEAAATAQASAHAAVSAAESIELPLIRMATAFADGSARQIRILTGQ